MKLIIALVVLAAFVGAGLLAAGQWVVGLLLLAPGLVLGVFAGRGVVRMVRQQNRSFRRSPLAADPRVAGSLRWSGTMVLLLAALSLVGAAAVLYAFGAMAADPGLDPAARGASVAGGLFLAGIPGLLGTTLLVHGRALWRGDPTSGGSATGLTAIPLVLAGLAVLGALVEGRPAAEIAYNRPGVLMVGSGIVLFCIVVLLSLGALTNNVEQAAARQRAGAGPEADPG